MEEFVDFKKDQECGGWTGQNGRFNEDCRNLF